MSGEDVQEWRSNAEELDYLNEYIYYNPEYPHFDYKPFQKFYSRVIRLGEDVIVFTAGESYDQEEWNKARQKLKQLSTESEKLEEKNYKLLFSGDDINLLADYMADIDEWKAHIPYKIDVKIKGSLYSRIYPEDYSAVQSVFVYDGSEGLIDKINEAMTPYEQKVVPKEEVAEELNI